jgi:hypothetical protein
MRLLLFAFVCAAGVSAAAARAQNAEAAGATAVSASVGPVGTTPSVAPTPPIPDAPAKPARLTWQKRFELANTSQDGHLTLEEAKAGYAMIARHFSAIDLSGKGYVTIDDVEAWHRSQRAAHKPSALSPQTMEPQHAFQRTLTPAAQINSATIKSLRQVPQHPAAIEDPVDPMTDNPTGDPR